MRLAIFDVDGTLVDSRSMITAAMARAFADVGIAAPDQDRMLSIVGLSLVDAMAALTPDESAATHRRLGESYKQAFWALRLSGAHPEDLFNGARDLLEDLRGRGVVLGIATGKSRRGVDHLIATHGFENWFGTVQTSDTHPSKPHPSMIVTALAETGCDPSATIMIGDTSFDMSMARQAGVAAAGVAWGNYPATELVTAGAHRVSKNFKQLALDLEALWEERGR